MKGFGLLFNEEINIDRILSTSSACPLTCTTVCSDGDIRLVGGSVASEGRVEVCYSNQWGTVCDIGWDDSDASVACGQAGFSLTGKIIKMLVFKTKTYF